MITVETTKLPGVLDIRPVSIHEDFRGTYVESYNVATYREAGIDAEFVQDDFAVSRRHVLRGIHGDETTTKLVSCPAGALYLVVVNNDKATPGYRHWTSFTLSAANWRQVLVPPKHGIGYVVLSDSAIFHYKQSTYYDRRSQFTIRWDDPDCGVYWPIRNPILSERDFFVD